VQFASDCECEEVCYIQLMVELLDLRPLLNYYFYNISRNKPLVWVDYTIQAVWSLFNNQLTHYGQENEDSNCGQRNSAARWNTVSVSDYSSYLSLGTFNTCKSPTWMLEMTTGVIKLLRSDCYYILRYQLYEYSWPDFLFFTDLSLTSVPCISIFR
jgi:hypothetical protein